MKTKDKPKEEKKKDKKIIQKLERKSIPLVEKKREKLAQEK